MTLRVRTLTAEEHLAFISGRGSVSFLQCPSWAAVKPDWRGESIGWVDDSGAVVGAGLVLYRQIPKVKRYLAYLPEGPVIDWHSDDLRSWLDPMLAHLKAKGAFSVKMGAQVAVRRWQAATVKDAIAAGIAKRLKDVPADSEDKAAGVIAGRLRELGWRQKPDTGAGFGDSQPRYVFQVPLKGRSLDEVFAGFNQLWRRNIRKAEKAGVEVSLAGYEDLPTFYELYRVTAVRDHFQPRPLEYFQRMFQAMNAEDPGRVKLYIARHEGEALAGTTLVTVGEHAWYSYGASADHKREVRPSNAVQWKMLGDAHAAGAAVYDLRGISDTLDAEDHLFGLIQFKVGTGGEAVEYLGEWDFPVNRALHRAFELYMSRR